MSSFHNCCTRLCWICVWHGLTSLLAVCPRGNVLHAVTSYILSTHSEVGEVRTGCPSWKEIWQEIVLVFVRSQWQIIPGFSHLMLEKSRQGHGARSPRLFYWKGCLLLFLLLFLKILFSPNSSFCLLYAHASNLQYQLIFCSLVQVAGARAYGTAHWLW